MLLLVAKCLIYLAKDRHEARILNHLVFLDQLHVERVLHSGDLELTLNLLEPPEDVSDRLANPRFVGLLVASLLRDPSHRGQGENEEPVDGEVRRRMVTVVDQLVDEGLDVPVVFEPHPELGGGAHSDTGRNEHGLEIDGDLFTGLIEVLRGHRPSTGACVAVRRRVALGRLLQNLLLMPVQVSDDQRVETLPASPGLPALEIRFDAVHRTPVRQSVVDRLRERSLVREVPGQEARLNGQWASVDGAFHEQFQQRVLQLGLRLVHLVEDHDLLLGVVRGVRARHPLRGGVVDELLVLRNDREAHEVAVFENGQVHVDRFVATLSGDGLRDLGLAATRRSENQRVGTSPDGEAQDFLQG